MTFTTTTLQERRDELMGEYRELQQHILKLDRERATAEQQALRMGGAIHVLEELLATDACVKPDSEKQAVTALR